MSEQSFGKYTLLKKIATGGMAEVWLARQSGIEGFQRELVLKRILPHLADDQDFVQMFLNEAKIAARFNHPNIAQVYDLGETNGQYFIAMEFVHGEDLGRLMRKAWSTDQWLARPLAIRIVASCCEGLYYAHTRTDENGRPLKVVHRDISPQNILISFDGSVKLVDFGIAKAADQASLTKSGAIKGKFAYMSPEQASGKPLDHRSDLFAIGLVLYELLTGVRPLKRDSEIATLQAALECAIEPPSQVADVPSELDAVVMRALTRLPDDRYRDARQFQLALEEILVSQRWVASSVQLSELMSTLFHERLEEEARSGHPEPGRSDSQVSVSVPGGKKSAQAAELSWEAPPGSSDGADRRGGARGASSRAEPRSPPPPPEPSVVQVPDWEAPAGAEVPGRRRSETSSRRLTQTSNETAIARTPSRGGGEAPRRNSESPARRISETRIAPVGQRDDDERLDDETEPPARDEAPQRRVSQPAAPRPASRQLPAARRPSPSRVAPLPEPEPEPELPPEEEELRTMMEEEPPRPAPPPQPRRRPQAPPPQQERPRKSAVAPGPRTSSAIPRQAEEPFLELEQRRARSRKQQSWVLYLCLTLVFAVTAFVFRQPIGEALTHTESGGQDVQLKVSTNVNVSVLVRHHKDETSSKAGRVEELASRAGNEPIRGAHLRDTVILENKQQGIHYEQEIEFGQPDEVREIRKEFKTGSVRIDSLSSKRVEGTLYENGQMRGSYLPGQSQKIQLYEGKHTLELHDKSGAPVGYPFVVTVVPEKDVPFRTDIFSPDSGGTGNP